MPCEYVNISLCGAKLHNVVNVLHIAEIKTSSRCIEKM